MDLVSLGQNEVNGYQRERLGRRMIGRRMKGEAETNSIFLFCTAIFMTSHLTDSLMYVYLTNEFLMMSKGRGLGGRPLLKSRFHFLLALQVFLISTLVFTYFKWE